ncbi:OpgC family protein [Halovulum sp. GXIMD14793]
MAETGAHTSRPRDPRLDFFRGLAMFIILLAHTPGNYWTLWIPARWGFSDATEIFVFCSGMASALAFGGVFERRGWLMGTMRILHRVWQVYWAHIAVFCVILTSMIVLNWFPDLPRDYVGQLNLYPFVKNIEGNMVGLMTLAYVPNYFDILPMYLVILAMVPIVMALSLVSPWAVFGFIGLVWFGTQLEALVEVIPALDPLANLAEILHLPAQYWFEPPNNTRSWFFNPFAWQLVFFTGFAFMCGWISPPPVRLWLIGLALVIVLGNVPLSNIGVRELEFDWARDWRIANREFFTKTDFGILRYVHFLALAYLGWAAVGPMGKWLSIGKVWTLIVGVIRKVGQQSLAVFMTSMVLARFMGVVFDVWGKDVWVMTATNLGGFAVLIVVAYFVSWIKRSPWKGVPAPRAAETSGPIQGCPA